MPKNGKKKKITDTGSLTLGAADFSMSIGNILGKEDAKPAEDKRTADDTARREKQPERGGDPDAAIGRLSRITLHRRGSGKGGKMVTVITLPKGAAISPETLAAKLGRELGCGSRVEEGKVVLQGDIQDRVSGWLVKKGVKRVVLGN